MFLHLTVLVNKTGIDLGIFIKYIVIFLQNPFLIQYFTLYLIAQNLITSYHIHYYYS